jgi:hypothetical protein
MANITLLPSAKVPLIYDGELTMTTEWYRFFWNIYGFTGTGVVPVNKGGTGLDTIGNHQLIIGNANNVFEPASLSSASINISYPAGFINLELGTSTVTPGTYGSASQVGVFTVNQYGVLTAAFNTSIAINANQITSGTLTVVRGGTGQSTYTDGQLLIGNTTGNTLTKATLTAGTGISVTNGAGSITIGNTGVLSVSGTAPVVSSGGATPAISMAAANTTTNGYLTSTDWNTFNNKAPATSGTSILYGNGSGGFSNVTIGTGISFAGGTLSATGSGGTVTSVSGTAPISVATGTTTPVISISQATTSTNGYLSSTDWNTFNNKQPAGTYVTSISIASSNGFTGTSSGGATPSLTLATSVTGILKGNGTAISAATSGTDYAPATSGTSILYGNGAGGFSNVTIGTGVSFAGGTLSATGSGGTVTSVAALTLGTTGTDLSSTVANSTTTPVITLNVPTASATNRGALSAADWTTFNSKANAFTYTTGYIPFGQGTTTPNQSANLFWDNTNARLGIGTATPAYSLDVLGSVGFGATINTGNGVSTGAANIELGGLRTGDGNSFIDFHSASGTDYETRIIRSAGANGNLSFSNLGTGNFILTNASTGNIRLNTIGAGPIELYTTNSLRMLIAAGGNIGVLNATPQRALDIGSATTSGLATYGGLLRITGYFTDGNAAQGLEFQGRGDGAGFGNRISHRSNNGDLVFEGRANSASWTEIARMFPTGGVSIGNTTDPGAGNLRFATNLTNGIYFGASSLLNDYETGTWTPTDGSGAGLSFTGVSAIYTKVGRLVTVCFALTFPTTANTAHITIAGLPYAVSSGTTNAGAGAFSYTNSSSTFIVGALFTPSAGATTINLYTANGATIGNNQFSAAVFRVTFTYTSST